MIWRKYELVRPKYFGLLAEQRAICCAETEQNKISNSGERSIQIVRPKEVNMLELTQKNLCHLAPWLKG